MWDTAHPQLLLSTSLQAGKCFLTLHTCPSFLQCDGELSATCWQKFEPSKKWGRLKLICSGNQPLSGQQRHHILVAPTGWMNQKGDKAWCQTSHQIHCAACKQPLPMCCREQLKISQMCGVLPRLLERRRKPLLLFLVLAEGWLWIHQKGRKKGLVWPKHTQLRDLASIARLENAWDWAMPVWGWARRAAHHSSSQPISAALWQLWFPGAAAMLNRTQVTENISSAGTQKAAQ